MRILVLQILIRASTLTLNDLSVICVALTENPETRQYPRIQLFRHSVSYA